MNGQCMCVLNYTIYSRKHAENDSTNLDIDNFLLFSDDIPQDSTPFSCSNLFDLAVSNASLVSTIGLEFANLQC